MGDFNYFQEFKRELFDYCYDKFSELSDDKDELEIIINKYIISLYRMDNEITSEMIHLYE